MLVRVLLAAASACGDDEPVPAPVVATAEPATSPSSEEAPGGTSAKEEQQVAADEPTDDEPEESGDEAEAFAPAMEPAIKPACGQCRGEPAYSTGIGQVMVECTKCQTVGSYPGIENDTGGYWGSSVYVILHSGELALFSVDLEIPCRGFNWKFERKYRSGFKLGGALAGGRMGHGWEFK